MKKRVKYYKTFLNFPLFLKSKHNLEKQGLKNTPLFRVVDLSHATGGRYTDFYKEDALGMDSRTPRVSCSKICILFDNIVYGQLNYFLCNSCSFLIYISSKKCSYIST